MSCPFSKWQKVRLQYQLTYILINQLIILMIDSSLAAWGRGKVNSGVQGTAPPCGVHTKAAELPPESDALLVLKS